MLPATRTGRSRPARALRVARFRLGDPALSDFAAQLVGVQISASTLSRWERDQGEPPVSILELAGRLTGLTLAELLAEADRVFPIAHHRERK